MVPLFPEVSLDLIGHGHLVQQWVHSLQVAAQILQQLTQIPACAPEYVKWGASDTNPQKVFHKINGFLRPNETRVLK